MNFRETAEAEYACYARSQGLSVEACKALDRLQNPENQLAAFEAWLSRMRDEWSGLSDTKLTRLFKEEFPGEPVPTMFGTTQWWRIWIRWLNRQ